MAAPEADLADFGEADDSTQHTRSDALGAEETPACQSCRKKKSKCSRHQPCSQCVKSGVDCVYDDKKLKGGIKTGVIERLSQRLDTIENMFLGQGVLLQQLLQARDATSAIAAPRDGKSRNGAGFADYTDRLKRSMCALAPAPESLQQDVSAIAKRRREPEPWVPSKRVLPMPDYTTISTTTLPPPERLEILLERYFKLIHPWIPILHPSTFMQRARVDPRSHGVSLILQAIIAVTGKQVPNGEGSDAHPSETFRRAVITASMDDNSLEACQALLLVAFDAMKRGTSNSPWSLCASICRKVEELQLNAEELSDRGTLADYFLPVSPALNPTNAWVEVEERRRVFWATFLLDRFCSIATGSNPIISSKSIRRRLPCDGCMWELDQAVETSFFKIHEQSKETADNPEEETPFPPAYSTAEGPSGIGGLAYGIEATESLYLVTKFHARHSLEIDNSAQLSTWLNRFRQLDSRLLQWELCLTHRWRDVHVVNGYIDPNLTLAHMTHNAAIIVLHQRLAHPPSKSKAWLSTLVSAASREACVMAAIKIDRIARRYLDASNGVPPHQFMYCLYIAGQLLLAQATHQAAKPSDEVGSIIAALHELSRRLDRRSEDEHTPDATQPENPAAKFANCLIEQRDVCPGESSRGGRLRPSDVDSVQLPPGLIDIPTMLQQYATSPSSGVSVGWLGLPADRESTSNDMMSLTQSLLPNARVADGGGAREYPSVHGHIMSPGDRDFDFIAELRRMETSRGEQASPEVWKDGAR